MSDTLRGSDALISFLSLNQTWAATETALQALSGAAKAGATLEAALGPRRELTRIGDTAVVPIHGVVNFREGYGADLIRLQSDIAAALSDSEVKQIVLDINSPGGSVTGLAEAAAFIAQARESKPIHAHANPLAASAAYWLGSQATTFSAMGTSTVGSIGVIGMHVSFARALEKFGIDVTIFRSGVNKAAGHPLEKLSDAAKERFETLIKTHYAQFLDAVGSGRNMERSAVETAGNHGAVFIGDEALDRGLIDRVETFGSLVTRASLPAFTAETPRDIRGLESALHDILGFSRQRAKQIASAGWKAGNHSESDATSTPTTSDRDDQGRLDATSGLNEAIDRLKQLAG